MIQASAGQIDPIADAPTIIRGEARSGTPLLSVDGLFVEFSGRGRVVRAVRGLSYDIAPGETIGLVGESGSGKSVSALSLLGLLPKRVGKVTAGTAHLPGRGHPPPARGAPAQDPWRQDRDDLPGPAVEPQPGADDRAADHRGASRRTATSARRRPRSGRSNCSSSSGSRARTSASTTTRTSSAAGCASGP